MRVARELPAGFVPVSALEVVTFESYAVPLVSFDGMAHAPSWARPLLQEWTQAFEDADPLVATVRLVEVVRLVVLTGDAAHADAALAVVRMSAQPLEDVKKMVDKARQDHAARVRALKRKIG